MQCFYQKKKDTNLGDFCGVYSSHNNIDIYVIAQNTFDILPD